MKIIPIAISVLLSLSVSSYYYKAQIADLRREHAEYIQAQAQANQKALQEAVEKEKNITKRVNDEKANIRKQLSSAHADMRRMHDSLSRLQSDLSRADCIRQRDEFARLATEANQLLIEIDEATRIVNTRQIIKDEVK